MMMMIKQNTRNSNWNFILFYFFLALETEPALELKWTTEQHVDWKRFGCMHIQSEFTKAQMTSINGKELN